MGSNEGTDMPVSDEWMEMTLVKSLHSGGPDVIHFSDSTVPDIQGASLVSAIRVKAENLLAGLSWIVVGVDHKDILTCFPLL